MPSDAVALVDVSSEPVTLTIGEQTFAVSPLGPGDFAVAEAHLRDQRVDTVVRRTQNPNLMTYETRGIAVARTVCEPILINDLLLSYESRLYMLWLSLKKRQPQLTLAQVKVLPGVTVDILTELMSVVTGIHPAEEEEPSVGGIPLEATIGPTS